MHGFTRPIFPEPQPPQLENGVASVVDMPVYEHPSTITGDESQLARDIFGGGSGREEISVKLS